MACLWYLVLLFVPPAQGSKSAQPIGRSGSVEGFVLESRQVAYLFLEVRLWSAKQTVLMSAIWKAVKATVVTAST